MHLRQSVFKFSACRSFKKSKGKIYKFKETGESRYIYQNELNKVCFQNYAAYKDFKGFPRTTHSEKYYVIKYLILLKIKNVMDVKEVLL